MNIGTQAPAGTAKRPGTNWPRVPAEFVRAVLKGHSALGLAFAGLIYLVCLTGTVAVFAREFTRWENPALPRLAQASPQAAEAAYRAALAKASGVIEHARVSLPGGDQSLLTVSLDQKGIEKDAIWAADADGRLAGTPATPWTEFLTTLHINLHLPRTWGEFLVGLIGVSLLSSLISGLLAHPRIFRDAFHLRLGGSRRLQEADLHNRLGVWALPFHVIVSLTGALLGLTTLIVGVLGLAVFHGDTGKVYALFIPPEPREDARPAPPPPIMPLIARVATLAPGGHIESIVVDDPLTAGATIEFLVADGSDRIAHYDNYLFDRAGTLIRAKRAADNNLGEAILGSIGQLHFGWFGGGIVKVAYGLLGLGLTYLAAGGVNIWLARRRDKGRPAPRLERLWTAIIWGQPLALAASALAILLVPAGGDHLAFLTWASISIAMLLAAILVSAERLSMSGRLATAAALMGISVIHIVARPNADPLIWGMDIVLLLAGLILGPTVLRRPPRLA